MDSSIKTLTITGNAATSGSEPKKSRRASRRKKGDEEYDSFEVEKHEPTLSQPPIVKPRPLAQQTLQYPQPVNNRYPVTKLMPYHLRMSSLEVLFNRYNVWRFILKEEDKIIVELVFNQFFYNKIKSFPRQIKNSPNTLIKLILPNKEDRLRVRNYFKKLSFL